MFGQCAGQPVGMFANACLCFQNSIRRPDICKESLRHDGMDGFIVCKHLAVDFGDEANIFLWFEGFEQLAFDDMNTCKAGWLQFWGW